MRQESHLESFSLTTSRVKILRRTDCELDRQEFVFRRDHSIYRGRIDKQLIVGVSIYFRRFRGQFLWGVKLFIWEVIRKGHWNV